MTALHLLKFVNELGPYRKFCTFLKASPYRVPSVRRLRPSLEPEMVRQLSTVKFSNCRKLYFTEAVQYSQTLDGIDGFLSMSPGIMNLSLQLLHAGPRLLPLLGDMRLQQLGVALGVLFANRPPKLENILPWIWIIRYSHLSPIWTYSTCFASWLTPRNGWRDSPRSPL
ncbi:hypothetical protein DFH09DRAFT_1321329 [Mycena vulgaris]|nr:hypothetical protein DFH09DRAFT_1321329 [Mycena vulgaris]